MTGADTVVAAAADVVVVTVGVVVVVVAAAAVVVVIGAEFLAVLVDVLPEVTVVLLLHRVGGDNSPVSVTRRLLNGGQSALLDVMLLLLVVVVVMAVVVAAEGVGEAEDVGDAEGGRLARRPIVDVRVPRSRGGEGHRCGVQTSAADHLEAVAVGTGGAGVKLARDDQSDTNARQHPESSSGLGGGAVHVEVKAAGHGFTHHHAAPHPAGPRHASSPAQRQSDKDRAALLATQESSRSCTATVRQSPCSKSTRLNSYGSRTTAVRQSP